MPTKLYTARHNPRLTFRQPSSKLCRHAYDTERELIISKHMFTEIARSIRLTLSPPSPAFGFFCFWIFFICLIKNHCGKFGSPYLGKAIAAAGAALAILGMAVLSFITCVQILMHAIAHGGVCVGGGGGGAVQTP